jgi:predicted RNA-binding protein associated with RNAse of E/G family
VASRLLSLQADPVAQQRIDELAEKCNEGQLTQEERDQYEAYVSAGNVIAVLQAKARALVAGHQSA